MSAPRRTALFNVHKALGAKMTTFGGFEMPVSYRGIVGEHLTVRNAAGIFDLSHMGEFEVRGQRALALIEKAFTNSAARLRDHQAQYTIMCAEDGGTIDDLIVYRRGDDRYMLCVNASNIAADWEWLTGLNASLGAHLHDQSDETGLVAIQGPRAIAIIEPLAEFPISNIPRFTCVEGLVAGTRCLTARTGYTGEDGLELFVRADAASQLFEAILQAGRSHGLIPCGLGARDTLRLEAGLALYGHELDRATSPLEAGLGTFVKLGRPFVGASALQTQRDKGLSKRLLGIFTDDGRSIARQGYGIFRGDREVGAVTSGTIGPTINRPIAMAYVSGDASSASSHENRTLEVEIRSRRVPVSVAPLPFYRRQASKSEGADS